ncbi:MAG: prephenate dehydrogenase/arogenate dehydrogenase family protein [Anaerotignaceae bacterium]
MFEKVGIIGLGLIGGSLAKALKNRLHVKEIVALNRREDVLIDAYNEGIINGYSTEVTEIFSGCDVVFICTPVDLIFEYTKKVSAFVSPSCIISDVGSTKGSIYTQMKTLTDKITYIGGHPMTGSEKFRYSAAKEHLFENAYYILTPAENVDTSITEEFKLKIEALGAIPVIMPPYEHDYVVASISHVPHIIASALCNSVNDLDNSNKHMHLLAAGGFKDITRIASSSPEMWKSICAENKMEIINSLTHLENVIANVKKSIECDSPSEIGDFFQNARQYRDSFANVTPSNYAKRYDIVIDVLDKPGSIAIISVLLSSNGINIKNMSILNNREQEGGVLHLSFNSEEERQKSLILLRSMNYEVHIRA